jgi:hypothetical protein
MGRLDPNPVFYDDDDDDDDDGNDDSSWQTKWKCVKLESKQKS